MWTIDAQRDALWLAIVVSRRSGQFDQRPEWIPHVRAAGERALLTLERRPIVAGVMFGPMAYKPQYGLLVPIFLIATGRWRAILAASITVGLLAALSLALFGAQTWQAFFTSITLTRHVVLEQGGSGFEKLQSAFAAARLWGFGVATAYVVQAMVSLDHGAGSLSGSLASTAKFDLPCRRQRSGTRGVLLMTPCMMDYDMVLLRDARSRGSRSKAAARVLCRGRNPARIVWLLPLFARSLAG